MKIGVVAPGSRVEPSVARTVSGLVAQLFSSRALDIEFHPNCFLSEGHFAGSDEQRIAAFVDFANSTAFDAIWIGRGGYGACRITEGLIPKLNAKARQKLYLGYSDAGFLLALLYRHGIGQPIHAPMPSDIVRANGEQAVTRVLRFLAGEGAEGLEPTVDGQRKTAAFNITILSHLLGTALEPDLSGHVLMLEEVSEHMYRIDRALFHITTTPSIRKVAGIRLGRCSAVPPNDPPFAQTEEEIVKHWCRMSGILYLGRADIGHDSDNRIVPFGSFQSR